MAKVLVCGLCVTDSQNTKPFTKADTPVGRSAMKEHVKQEHKKQQDISETPAPQRTTEYY